MSGLPSCQARSDRAGFTLVEVLAALAIGSVIILSMAALMRNVGYFFDRGVRGVSEGERLVLVGERLATDFASARFLLQSSTSGPASTFTGEPAKVIFVTGGGVASGPQGEEVVELTAEGGEAGTARLVRRRAAWLGPRTRLEAVKLQDNVVLIAGQLDIAFAFGRSERDGTLSWTDRWTGEVTLPRLIRVTLRDRTTGVDLLGGGEFVIRSDAPPACANANAKIGCLSGTTAARTDPPLPSGKSR
jgi:prepilin-type N-terminal cleavage/methylation domain-containing protein